MTRTATAPSPRSVYSPRMRKKPRKRLLRLDSEGRLRIPPGVLKKAGLKPTDRFEVEILPGRLVLRGVGRGLVRENGRLVFDGVMDGDMQEAIDRIKREDDEDLNRRCLGR